MVKDKEPEASPERKKESPPMCMVGQCKRHHAAQFNIDGFWLPLCWVHHNALTDFLLTTPAHKNYLIAMGNYRKYLSGFPSTTGIETSNGDILDEIFEAEAGIRNVIKYWLLDHIEDQGSFENWVDELKNMLEEI